MLKEFVLTAPRTLQYREYVEPALLPNEVRIRTHITGIKPGTELKAYRGETPFLTHDFDMAQRTFVPRPPDHPFYPATLGCWGVGQVIEIGSSVTQFKKGDLVHSSMLHRPTNVKNANDVFLLPPSFAPEAALFSDPTIFALSAIHDAQVKTGDRVAIFGLGALGLIALQLAKLQGAAQVFAIDVLPERLALAQQFGADHVINAIDEDAVGEIRKHTQNKGVDAVIEISGSMLALQSAIRAVHQGGMVVTVSFYKSGQPTLNLGMEWHHNRPTLISSMPVWGNISRYAPMWDFQRLRHTAVQLLAQHKLLVLPMLSQRFAYGDAAQAYELLDQSPTPPIKVALVYER
jgi:threonine dehydrogenase-like Zn-dependent dehydrogenase